MNPFAAIAVYFVLWWLCLFMTLPFGIKGQHEGDEGRALGTDPGAPLRPLLIRKVAATTVVSAILFAGVYLYFGVYGMTLEDLIPAGGVP